MALTVQTRGHLSEAAARTGTTSADWSSAHACHAIDRSAPPNRDTARILHDTPSRRLSWPPRSDAYRVLNSGLADWAGFTSDANAPAWPLVQRAVRALQMPRAGAAWDAQAAGTLTPPGRPGLGRRWESGRALLRRAQQQARAPGRARGAECHSGPQRPGLRVANLRGGLGRAGPTARASASGPASGLKSESHWQIEGHKGGPQARGRPCRVAKATWTPEVSRCPSLVDERAQQRRAGAPVWHCRHTVNN
jgi:hypothetical protein